MAETTPELAAIIQRFGDQVERMHIRWERILLFGSHLQQVAREGSDIDLCVVSPDWAPYSDRERREILGVAAARILEPIQASGVTPAEIADHRLSSFWEETLNQAIVVAERASSANNLRDGMKPALLHIPDLFFAPRIADALAHLGFTTREVDATTDVSGASMLVVQLTGPREIWLPLIRAARDSNVPVLAFGRHTDAETLRAARQAGANKVVPNSELVTELPTLVAQLTGAAVLGEE